MSSISKDEWVCTSGFSRRKVVRSGHGTPGTDCQFVLIYSVLFDQRCWCRFHGPPKFSEPPGHTYHLRQIVDGDGEINEENLKWMLNKMDGQAMAFWGKDKTGVDYVGHEEL